MVHSKAANGSTIGLGITEAFAHSGANVVLNGFGDAVQIEKTRSELAHGSKAKVVYSPADLSKPRRSPTWCARPSICSARSI
jgi:3-hydroxybutyrate dehydrogenase